MSQITAYIALGANLGDREGNIRQALSLLQGGEDVEVLRVSSLIETPAEGGEPDAPPYLNGAAEVRTSLPASALLSRLLEVEAALGRTRRNKWESRPIDLDILLFEDHVINEPELTVPHPRLCDRLFVLRPLAQLAADVMHPALGVTIGELLRQLEHGRQRGK